MEKIVNRLINESVVNVDRYNNNNSTWLIFTETKQWVIELTKDGTLWYNYNFFKNLFNYLGVDVVENQHYITKWVEDTIQNGVKDTWSTPSLSTATVEDTIQNGVKHTPNISLQLVKGYGVANQVENTIKNGVKHTIAGGPAIDILVEDTIQNGVKKTLSVEEGTFTSIGFGIHVEDTIQNGIKETQGCGWSNQGNAENVIKNGVKHTEAGGYLGSITLGGKLVHMVESPKQNEEVEDVIQHGVIETFDETHHRRREVVQTIRDGIKETIL
jgi:hypothetical protein